MEQEEVKYVQEAKREGRREVKVRGGRRGGHLWGGFQSERRTRKRATGKLPTGLVSEGATTRGASS